MGEGGGDSYGAMAFSLSFSSFLFDYPAIWAGI